MKFMVVGGAGFIGSNLIERLLKDQTNEVICVDNFLLGSRKNIERFFENQKFSFYQIDASDYSALSKLFEEKKPEAVYHLAANSDIRLSATNPDIDRVNTFETTHSILRCMFQFQVKKLFFASTSAVYGQQCDKLLNEETGGLLPISYYGGYKLASEALISSYAYMNDFECVIFRFPNVIGPNLTHGVVYDFVTKLKQDSSVLSVLGDGSQDKQYIYVDDLVDAILLCTKEFCSGVSVLNAGVVSSTTVKKIAEMVLEAMSLTDTPISYSGGSVGWKGDVPRFRYDLSKIHALGWRAKYTSDEAVKLSVEKFLEGQKS